MFHVFLKPFFLRNQTLGNGNKLPFELRGDFCLEWEMVGNKFMCRKHIDVENCQVRITEEHDEKNSLKPSNPSVGIPLEYRPNLTDFGTTDYESTAVGGSPQFDLSATVRAIS